MKKVVKFLLYTLGIILIFVVVGATFIHFRGIPKYEVKKIDFKVVSSPEKIEKGRKMALMLCSGCHLDSKTGGLTGKLMADAPPEFGKIYSANITKDPNHGIGKWSDNDLAYLLRTGLKPDGQYLPPYMPKLVHASDEDLASIIAFLRSDDPLIKAQPIPKKPSEPSFLTKFLCTSVFTPLPYPEKSILIPDQKNQMVFGEYLINTYDCYSCHSADFTTNDFFEPRKSKGYMGGGNTVYNLDGKKVLTANLSPDKETGIGNWTKEQFVNCLKLGKKPDGTLVKYPMLPYIEFTDEEAEAIFVYLKTIPAIKNKVKN